MKRVVNWLLGISLVMLIFLGFLIYRTYLKSKSTDTTLLELNTSEYQDPVKLKEGKYEDISVNYIFYISSEEELKDVVIEILQCSKNRLAYLSVPLDTSINVTAELYRKMSIKNPAMPQFFQLSEIGDLFDEKDRFGYAQIILDEMLSIDSSYYTVIRGEESDFKSYQEAILHGIVQMDTEQVKELMKSVNSNISSNLTKKERLKYARYYAKITIDNLSYEEVAGIKHTDSFEMNLAACGNQIKVFMSGE